MGRPKMKSDEKRKVMTLRLSPATRREVEVLSIEQGESIAKVLEGLIAAALSLTESERQIAIREHRVALLREEINTLQGEIDGPLPCTWDFKK